ATQGPPGQSACRNAWRRGTKKVKDANQCRTHSLVESEKVLSLAPNHRVRLPIGSTSNPIYAISPGSLIHAMRINHDMCVFAHIHNLGSAHLRSPAARRPKSPRSRAAPSFRLEERSKAEPALERAHSAERFHRRGGPDVRSDAASALEIEVRVRVLVAFNDRFAGEGVQLVLSRPQFDPTDLAGDRLRQLGELEAADALVRCEVLPAVGEDRP